MDTSLQALQLREAEKSLSGSVHDNVRGEADGDGAGGRTTRSRDKNCCNNNVSWRESKGGDG